MAESKFLPGSNAVLVYFDEHGIKRSLIVEVVSINDFRTGTTWYVVKGRQDLLSKQSPVVPLERAKIDVEEGMSIVMIRADQLAPVGTRAFRIIP